MLAEGRHDYLDQSHSVAVRERIFHAQNDRVVPAMKRKNPQDATLRNIRALKKRVQNVEIKLAVFVSAVRKFQRIYERHMKEHAR